MEELASHGYVVFSVAHPGGSSGLLYPDGSAVPYDQDWRDAVLGAVGAPDPEGRHSPDVGKRYEAAVAWQFRLAPENWASSPDSPRIPAEIGVPGWAGRGLPLHLDRVLDTGTGRGVTPTASRTDGC